MRTTLLGLAAALALTLTACSTDDDSDATTEDPPASAETTASSEAETSSPAAEPTETPAPGDDRTFPPGPNTLSFYEGMPSYPWRVNIVDNQDVLLPAMQAIAPHLDEGDYSDVLNSCDSLNGGTDRAQVNENGVVRFSGGPDEQVTLEEATQLVDLSIQYACPDLG